MLARRNKEAVMMFQRIVSYCVMEHNNRESMMMFLPTLSHYVNGKFKMLLYACILIIFKKVGKVKTARWIYG